MEMLTPDCKYPFLVFDNVVPEDQFLSLNEEIKYLDKFIIDEPDVSGSALSDEGIILKKNKCLWLHDFYGNSKYSTIITNISKIIRQDVVEAISNYDNAFIFYPSTVNGDKNGLLLSKYENGDYYKTHYDTSYYTAVLWLHEEPKRFSGGEFRFHFPNGEIEEVECKNNRMVLFPSVYDHEVTAVVCENNDCARYAVSAFFSRKDS